MKEEREKSNQLKELRNRAEETLRSSKETIQALIDATPESALLVNANGIVLAINEIAAQRLGKSKDGIIGRIVYNFLPSDVAKNRAEKLKEVLESGKPVRFSDERAGRHYYNSLYPVFDADGNVEKIAIFTQDLTMQHQTELALRDSEERYRQLFENESDAVMVFDAESRQFEDANKAALDLYQYSKEEFLALTVEDISAEKEKTRSNVQKITDDGHYLKRLPLRYFIKKDGTRFPGEISAGTFISYGCKKIIGAVRDITERLHAQEALQQSEARYRALSEATFEAIFISEKGVCIDTNQRATEMFGYDYDKLTGIFGTKVIAPEFKKSVERNMLSGYEKPYEAIAQKKDGTKFYVEICGKMMKYKDKDVRITVVHDIDEQKRTEEALRESEKRYRNLFNSIPIGLYRTTPEGQMLDINPAMVEILGYPDQETLLNTKIQKIYVNLEDRNRMKLLLKEKGSIRDFKVPLCRFDGSVVWVSIHTKFIHDADNKISYYDGAMEDITDRKQAGEQIHTLSQQLIEAQETERQMISRELHDRIAQDLSSLKIGFDTLFDNHPAIDSKVSQKISKLSKMLQETIAAVRDLSYDLRPPGLYEMGFIPALSMYCDEFSEKSETAVNFNAVGMKNIQLDSDTEINVFRLIQEGLNNIRKHADARHATIRLVGASPNIILRIEDAGKGFDVEARERALDGEKRMGLRSMMERVKLLRGQMKIHSRPLEGTKIDIKFSYQEKEDGSKKNHIDR